LSKRIQKKKSDFFVLSLRKEFLLIHWRSQKFWLGVAQIRKKLWRNFGDVFFIFSVPQW